MLKSGNIQGDSHGYVPGAVKAGSGTIIRFRLPYRHGVEDDLVMVEDHLGKTGWIKPSNIIK